MENFSYFNSRVAVAVGKTVANSVSGSDSGGGKSQWRWQLLSGKERQWRPNNIGTGIISVSGIGSGIASGIAIGSGNGSEERVGLAVIVAVAATVEVAIPAQYVLVHYRGITQVW